MKKLSNKDLFAKAALQECLLQRDTQDFMNLSSDGRIGITPWGDFIDPYTEGQKTALENHLYAMKQTGDLEAIQRAEELLKSYKEEEDSLNLSGE